MIKKCVSVKHISIFVKMIFHFRFSAKEMALDPILDEIKDF